MNDGKREFIKNTLRGYTLFHSPNYINETIAELFVEELIKEKRLECLTEQTNNILCDYLGLNESGELLSFKKIAQKYNSSRDRVRTRIKDAVSCIRFRINYIDKMRQSDHDICVGTVFDAIKELSNKTLLILHNNYIYEISDFMSIGEESTKSIKGLGPKGYNEVKNAQKIINENPKKELPIVEEPVIEETKESTPTPRELKLNKLVLLMKQKQLLQEQLNSLDDDINKLLSSIDIDGDFDHGIR